MRIAVFKPGVANANTAFEAMSLLYRYSQERYGAEVELFIDRGDTFRSEHLRITRLDGRSPPDWLQGLGAPVGPFYPDASWRMRDFHVVATTDPFLYYHSFLPALAARRIHGLGLVADASLTFIPEGRMTGWRGRARSFLGRRWSRFVDTFLATTPAALERLQSLGALEEGARAEVLGHPVDTSRFRPGRESRSDRVRALSVGRLVYEKGHLDLVRAMRPLFDEYSGLSLKIVGSGPLEGRLRALLRELGLQGRVELVGEVPHADLSAHYREADLFVGYPRSTSFWEEYFGVVYVEAMSAGLPVVTSRCGGIPHVVEDGESGLLVPQGDAGALRGALRKMLDSAPRRRSFGRRARRRAEERFSVEVLGDRFYAVCRAAAGGKREE